MTKCCASLIIVLWLASQSAATGFPGWQAMRVIEQEGRPRIIRHGDLDGDGHEELIVVNTRHSRLDIYRWLPVDQRKQVAASPVDRPNDLPMAPELERDELTLEHLPQNLVVQDLDGDGLSELIVLVAPPNRILIYERDEEQWKQARTEDLLDGELAPHASALLIRPVGEQQFELLISLAEGVQTLRLAPESRPAWLTPREQRGRIDWWLSDLDGDGDHDLIERSRDAKEAIRWFECAADGHLMPAAVLYDQAVGGACLLRTVEGPAQMLLLDGATEGLLRRFRLDRDDPSPVGKRRALALADGAAAVWCGLTIEDRAALVVVDPDGPQLLTYVLSENGWEPQQTFPGLSDVRAIAAPQAEPGMLLLQPKDAADLMVSRWDNGRLTYPKPWPRSEDEADRKILELATAGPVTWWVQRVGDFLDLYVWAPDQNKPRRTRFEGEWTDKRKKRTIGAKANKAIWVGGERLLVKQLHAQHAQLVVHQDGKTVITEPAHLKKARFAEFRHFPMSGKVRVGRLTDGVLQWLGDDLHAVDQIMLAHGEKMSDYIASSSDAGWALQQDGRFLHRMREDESGIAKVVQSVRMPGGINLIGDPVLGLMLLGHNRITQLSEGRTDKLTLLDSIDHRVGRPSGVKHATIHRIKTTDAREAGSDDLMLFDDRRHQLTLLADEEGKLAPQISWPVFEDKQYPYADENSPLIREPRAVLALDLDGDRQQDLAMVCHDRILIYLARGAP